MARSGAVAVIGMHRSGTSVTARILNLLGVDLGPRSGMLDPLPDDNPLGYWEQREVMSINDKVFDYFGGSWTEPPDFPPGWERSERIAPLRAEAVDFVAETFRGSLLWGVKDPRMSLTIPFWRNVVGDIACVLCVRNPIDVAASWSRRGRAYTREAAYELWLTHTAGALANSEPGERLIVFYEDYFDDLEAQVARLAGFLDMDPNDLAPELRAEIRSFVRAELWTNRSSPEDVLASEELPVEVRALWEALRAIAERERRIEELEEELERHRRWLTSVHSSVSWRITGPLRGIKQRRARADS